jgi:N-glycosidase YbiA
MAEPLYFYTKTMPFWGLSNFAPPGFENDGIFWPTVEHFFQAQKFESFEIRDRIR